MTANSRLRATARTLYHRLPLSQQAKWRLRERLQPVSQVLRENPSVGALARGLWLAAKGNHAGARDERDGLRELALRNILANLAEHAKCHGQPTHWIALPFLATGGAEKVALGLCRALRELRPDRSVVLLVTDRRLVAESMHIPEGVALIVLDDYLGGDLTYPRKQALLRDLLVAARPQCFHNINSEVAWHLILAEGERLARFVPLFASIFAFQFAPDGRTKIGYAAYFLAKGMPFLSGLLSDNRRFINDAAAEYGFGPELRSRMHVLYQPCALVDEQVGASPQRRQASPNARPQVLWAGRLDAEKRVDLFLDVVRRCTFADFRVFGQVVLDGAAILPSLPNLSYEGPFTSPSQWGERFEFDAFLFTSKWEGMPNILLEAGALGIPIVAPTVGGVGELITAETGYPLPERPTADDYEQALLAIVADPEGAQRRAASLSKCLGERHRWSQFVRAVAAVPGYGATPASHRTAAVAPGGHPQVSVIVPCYNQGRYLYESVSSLLAACHVPMEIILVDDGSTDPRTERFLVEAEALAPGVVRVLRKTNGGLSSARNAGLELARGEFIQFLDADDLVAPGKIDAQVAQLMLSQALDVSVCNFLLCDESRSHFSKPDEAIARFDMSLEDFLYRWERGFSVPIHCGLFRRRVLGDIRFDTHARAKEDWLFWTSLALAGVSFGYIHGHWAIYRQHEGSMRRSYVNMGRSWLQAGLKIEAMLGGREPLFFESVVSWFEQCYRANPAYREEVASLQAAAPAAAATAAIPSDSIAPVVGSEGLAERVLERLRSVGPVSGAPLISVVIPVYNHFDHLEECLTSLAGQGRVSLELVCVDDASPDDRVRQLMRALSDRLPHLKVIMQPVNRGISRSQNDAVAVATGEFVAFLDCDDALVPGALEVLAGCVQDHPDVDYFFTDRLDVDEAGRVVRTARYGGYDNLHFRGQEHIRADLLDGMVASHLKVIRRSSYVEAGGCDDAFSGVQDWALALAIAQRGKLHYVNQPLYRHRVHAQSVTRSDSVAQFRKSNVLRRRYGERWLRNPGFEADIAPQQVFARDDFPVSLAQLKAVWQGGVRCVADLSGRLDVSRSNFLREFNSYFDEIRWDDPAVPASLLGYLWSDAILVPGVPARS